MGITSARDNFAIDFVKNELTKRILDFCDKNLSTKEFQNKYNLKENYQWKIQEQRQLISSFNENLIEKICYRPFDIRYIYFQDNIVFRARRQVMNNFNFENYALNLVKIGRNETAHNYFITNQITDKSINSSLDNSNVFPLYLYPETTTQQTLEGFETLTGLNGRVPNLNMEIVNEMAKKLDIPFVVERHYEERSNLNKTRTDCFVPRKEFAPIDILDYIYAVLHSPSYREKYKEFLKIDFPRVPYPKDLTTFEKLSNLGSQLRQIHLLESEVVDNLITQYPEDGNNVVRKVIARKNDEAISNNDEIASSVAMTVYINEKQYFANVPEVAWNFYIGGYQPAQKWLKDRKGRELNHLDIVHYQKIIVALNETDRLMKEIDTIEI